MQLLPKLLPAIILLANAQATDNVISSTASEQSVITSTTKFSNPPNSTCEARTINYITHRLPQQCLKSGWSSIDNPASTTVEPVISSKASISEASWSSGGEVSPSITDGNHPTSSQPIQGTATTVTAEFTAQSSEGEELTSPTASTASTTLLDPAEVSNESRDDEESALDDASFLSFEDWKRQNLENSGQSSQHGSSRKTGSNIGSQEHMQHDEINNALDSLGDDGEIALDFGVFGRDEARESQPSAVSRPSQETKTGKETGQPRLEAKRSKDAGTTCKERSNFVSADCGAAVLNSNAQAKSAKAVLTENKDSYLLNECSASNKFLIVEMCDDILVDTIVLANFEFFSSQFRQFRVSVSDRYPVKLDKWKDLGTFEARNARGIQAFAVTEPRIWASVLRVHGTTMISEFRAEAAGGDDDVDEEGEILQELNEKSPSDNTPQHDFEQRAAEELKEAQGAIEELIRTAEQLSAENFDKALHSSHVDDIDQLLRNVSSNSVVTPWTPPGLEKLTRSKTGSSPLDMCFASETPKSAANQPDSESGGDQKTTDTVLDITVISKEYAVSNSTAIPSASRSQDSPPAVEKGPTIVSVTAKASENTTNTAGNLKETASSLSSSISAKLANTTSSSTNKISSTSVSSASPSPSTQESFFKTVHRRLQLLEANSTLSLKYIEEQSKILRDAFVKVEKRQLNKTTTFLENLNSTVLAELHVFRQQYDQIWQSTVIELETQRDQSQREILAVSARLTLLADEVIFQKRMSIVQSVLLLLCLGLVIFSRGFAGSYVDFPMGRTRSSAFLRFGSPPESPDQMRSDSQDEEHKGYHPRTNRAMRSNRIETKYVDRLSPISASSLTSDEDPAYMDTHHYTGEHKDIPEFKMRANERIPNRDFQVSLREDERHSPISNRYRHRDSDYVLSDDVLDDQNYDEMHDRSDEDFETASLDNNVEYNEPGNDPMEEDLPPLPSPPPEHERSTFVIARKPLPALPHE